MTRYTAAAEVHRASLSARDGRRQSLPLPDRGLRLSDYGRVGAVEEPAYSETIHCRRVLGLLPKIDDESFDPLFDGWGDLNHIRIQLDILTG